MSIAKNVFWSCIFIQTSSRSCFFFVSLAAAAASFSLFLCRLDQLIPFGDIAIMQPHTEINTIKKCPPCCCYTAGWPALASDTPILSVALCWYIKSILLALSGQRGEADWPSLNNALKNQRKGWFTSADRHLAATLPIGSSHVRKNISPHHYSDFLSPFPPFRAFYCSRFLPAKRNILLSSLLFGRNYYSGKRKKQDISSTFFDHISVRYLAPVWNLPLRATMAE